MKYKQPLHYCPSILEGRTPAYLGLTSTQLYSITILFPPISFTSFPVSGQRSSSDVLTRETGDHQEPGPATAALQDETLDPQPQPDVVSAEVPGKGLVRTAHVRVSNRVPLVELKLKPYGPIYNELDHDVSNILL